MRIIGIIPMGYRAGKNIICNVREALFNRSRYKACVTAKPPQMIRQLRSDGLLNIIIVDCEKIRADCSVKPSSSLIPVDKIYHIYLQLLSGWWGVSSC